MLIGPSHKTSSIDNLCTERIAALLRITVSRFALVCVRFRMPETLPLLVCLMHPFDYLSARIFYGMQKLNGRSKSNGVVARVRQALFAFSALTVLAGAAVAETYDYDELGRLIRIIYDDGSQVDYVHDAAGNRVSETVSNVPVNVPPVAADDTLTLVQNETRRFNPTDNDTDGNNDVLTVASFTAPGNGTLVRVNGNTLEYTPNLDFLGPDSFTYTIEDGRGGSDTATVSLTINANQSPVANADQITGLVDTQLVIDPRQNDTDADGHQLTITGVTPFTGGTAQIINNGTQIQFDPNPGFVGSKTVSYTVSDGYGGMASADITVQFKRTPVAVMDRVRVEFETALDISVLSNDVDPDGDAITLDSVAAGSHGTTSIISPGVVRYTPNTAYVGLDEFTYSISDADGMTDTGTVSVLVVKGFLLVINADGVVQSSFSAVQENIGGTVHYRVRTANTTLIYDSTVGYCDSNAWLASSEHVFTGIGCEMAFIGAAGAGGNGFPVANNDTATTDQDVAVTISALANDTDPDNDPLTITSATNGSYGTVAVAAGGASLTYTPSASFAGTDSFTYTISDGEGGHATGAITVTVNSAVNGDPVAAADAVTATEDIPETILAATLLANDTDPDNDVLTIASVANVINGSAVLDVNGNVVFTSNADYFGSAAFDYTADDGNGGTSTATVTVTVSAANDAPVAVDDTAVVNEDEFVTINPLTNDTDIDNDTLTIASATNGTNGTADVAVDGLSILYMPNAGYNGSDSFTYTISDGNGGSATATISVTVTPVNDAPVANNDTATTDEDTAVTITPLANDTDVEGDTLTIASATNGANGTVSVAVDNLSVTYTPAANYEGADSFTYTVSDGNGGSATGSVSVTVNAVNDAPVANDDTATTDEDVAAVITTLANDTDVDGHTLTITAATNGTNGTVSVAVDGVSVTYTPNAEYSGADSFTYTISDGNGGSDTANVSVTVSPVNDPPVAVADSATATEDTPETILAATLLANDTDPENDTLTLSSVASPVNGTAALDVNGDVLFTPDANFAGSANFDYTADDGNGGTNSATVTIDVAAVNDAPTAANDTATVDEDSVVTVTPLANDTDVDGDNLTIASATDGANGTVSLAPDNLSLTYTPNAGYSGADSFTYSVSDGNGGSDTASVAVTVNAVNDAPVAVDDSATTDEDNAVTISPLANDTDAENDPLTIASATNGTNGTVTVALDSLSVTYTPNADFAGADSFTYTASDGNGGSASATVTVTVNAVNDAPVAVNDNVTTDEETAVVVTPLANDTDAEADTLTIVSATNGTNGTVTVALDNLSVTYTPNADFAGADSFSYTVTDGNGGNATGTVSVTVNAVNDAPTAVADTATLAEDTPTTILASSLLANDTDPENDTLTIASVGAAVNGSASLDVNGDVVFTPNADYVGAASFDYTADDGNGGTSTASVTVDVTPVNDAPVAVADTATTVEDTQATILAATLLSNDTDVENDTLTIASVSNAVNGTASLDVNGDVVFTPAADFAGAASFDYTADDGNGGTNTTTVTVNVTPVNDVPTAVADAVAVPEDTPTTILASTLVANDTDPDNDTLTIASVAYPSNGTAALDLDGNVLFTPDAGYVGAAAFDYTADDGNGGTSTTTVTVDVTPVNDPPAAVADSVTVVEDTSTTLLASSLLANDTDPENDTLTIASVGNLSNGTASLDVNGDVLFTPDSNFFGTASFDYTADDGNGGTDTATVTVDVTAVNDAPVVVADSLTAAEDTPTTIPASTLLSNDTDAENDTLTVTSVTNAVNATASLDVNGDVQFTPNAGYVGPASFDYTVDDGNGGSSTGTANVEVQEVNDPPTAVADSTTVVEDTPTTILASVLLANDTDPENNTLTIASVGNAVNGTASLDVNGDVLFTPDADYVGAASFDYTADDGNGGTSTASVAVDVTAVNDPPVAVADSVTATEDTPETILASTLLANDTDVESDPLTITSVGNGTNGSVALDVNGDVLFTPNSDYAGVASFDYTAGDGNGGSATATVTVNVSPVNDAPMAVSDNATILEDTPTTILASALLANDTDPENDTLTIASVANAVNGTASLDAGGDVLFTPNAAFIGTASFDYTADDGNGGTSSATVTVDVQAAPQLVRVEAESMTLTGFNTESVVGVASNDQIIHLPYLEFIGFESALPPFSGTATYTYSGQAGTFDLVLGYFDENDGTSTVDVSVNGSPVGSVTFDQQLGSARATAATKTSTVVATAIALTSGDTIQISGNTSVREFARIDYLDIIVNAAANNNPPTAVADTATISEDTPTTILASSLVANDTDPDNDTLTIASVANAANGTASLDVNGDVLFTPNANFSGAASFDYTADDGNGGTSTATVTVSVTAVNDFPTAVADTVAVTEDTLATILASALLANDTDPDNDTLTISAVGSATNGVVSLDVNGDVAFTPNAGYVGAASFDYTANDGNGGTSSVSVSVQVQTVNDPPVAVADSATVTEDTPATILASALLANDTDPENDTLTVASVANAVNGTASLDVNGDVLFTPATNFAGTASFDYTADDGNGGTNVATVTVTVTSVNDAPVAAGDSLTVTEDTPTTILASTLLANDTDVENDTLTITALGAATNGTASLDVNGDVQYTPNVNYAGSDSFTYDISDGNGGASSATVSIGVTAVNDAPTAVADSVTATEDTATTFLASTLLANDTDPENDTLTIASVANAVNGTASLDVNGDVLFTPNTGYTGAASFDYTANDGNGGTSSAVTVSVDVQAAAQPVRIETEDMSLTGFQTDTVSGVASNNQIVRLPSFIFFGIETGTGATVGTATSTFAGSAGTYDITLGYFDENDGTASAVVNVNGSAIGSKVFDQSLGSSTASAANKTSAVIATNVSLAPGDSIQIVGTRAGGEMVRVDYLDIVPSP